MAKNLFIPQVFGDFLPNAMEVALSQLLENHPDQRRFPMVVHPILARVARAKAWDMANRGYEGHIDPDGHGANWLVRQAGYRLPDFYSKLPAGNNVESLQHGGVSEVNEALRLWLTSEGHRIQLLGLDDFYWVQTNYGIGYAHVPGSRKEHYYVFISAPPEGFYDDW